ncbi:ferredoxin reductase [Chitinivorax sp. PXF-14]|uniref:ferredoxin reductase n=1 Tax=Chitinivorax sp. PXF-14 TaxID=3230488 RepID=UPI0034652ABD
MRIPVAVSSTLLPNALRLAERWVPEPIVDFYASLLSPQWRLHRVVARVESLQQVAAETLLIRLRPNHNWRGCAGGQHVQLTVEIDGVRHVRSYSPIKPSRPGRAIEIAVRREPAGVVSGWLHDCLKAGDYLELSQAFGDFRLPEPPPPALLFIAAGSGVTPLLAMVHELFERKYTGDIAMLYYGRTQAGFAFADTLQRLAYLHPNFNVHLSLTGEEAPPRWLSGRFEATHLQRVARAGERTTFVCGGHGFTEAVRLVWQSQAYFGELHVEAFSPPPPVVEGEQQAVTLTFARSKQQYEGSTGLPLLNQAEASGLRPACGCRMGICFSCSCKKLSGAVRDIRSGKVLAEPGESIQLCVCAPLTDVVLDL